MNDKMVETVKAPVLVLREDAVSTDTDALIATPASRVLANIPSHALKIPRGLNIAEITFGANADNATTNALIYVARLNGDPLLAYNTGLITAGAQKNTDGKFLADTIVAGVSYWPKAVTITDAGGDDQIARISFDLLGHDKIFVLYDDLQNTSTWQAYLSGY